MAKNVLKNLNDFKEAWSISGKFRWCVAQSDLFPERRRTNGGNVYRSSVWLCEYHRNFSTDRAGCEESLRSPLLQATICPGLSERRYAGHYLVRLSVAAQLACAGHKVEAVTF